MTGVFRVRGSFGGWSWHGISFFRRLGGPQPGEGLGPRVARFPSRERAILDAARALPRLERSPRCRPRQPSTLGTDRARGSRPEMR